MSADSQRWKTKYFTALEQHETDERQWQMRFDLLRRGVLCCSLAAEGADTAVDQSMQAIREVLRKDDADAALQGIIPRLERTLLDSEQRRAQRLEDTLGALRQLIEQLIEQEPPRDVRKALKALGKQLADVKAQPYRLPAVLSQLSQLQAQTLEREANERESSPGLLQRLFGRGGGDETAEPAPDPASSEAGTIPQPQASASLPGTPEVVATTELPLAATAAHAAPSSAGAGNDQFELYGSEPGYSAVAPHVAESLTRMLRELDVPSYHQPQADALLQRLSGQLNWYELVPILDDLAVLVLAANDSGQRDFASYLQQLNERLELFTDGLSKAQGDYQSSSEAHHHFNQSLREQVSVMQSRMAEATDLQSLKQALDSRLDGLLQSVSLHQRERERHEHELAERLTGLLQRVAEMEQEAQGFRQHIEEQRQKSLRDPLTGLPNRAAWQERLDMEVARHKRYGGELLMAVVDVDPFKRINDNYGHLAGDKVLKIIATELQRRLRKSDFIARFGGEEFVLLIPATPLEGGQQLLETLRQAIEACPFHFKGEPVTITCSAGLSAFADGDTPERVFDRADKALYRAKNGGRNRIEVG